MMTTDETMPMTTDDSVSDSPPARTATEPAFCVATPKNLGQLAFTLTRTVATNCDRAANVSDDDDDDDDLLLSI